MSARVPRRRFLQLCAGGLLGAAACATGSVDGADVAGRAGVPAPVRRPYGDHDQAFGDLWLPEGTGAPVPVVVLVHGGFWGAGFGLDLMDGLAASVASVGWAAWNVEYRRLGSGGGYPETFDDVAAAVDHLAAVDAPLDLDRVAIVGHSAGGQLAAWAASRPTLPPEAPWSEPAVAPRIAVPQAGVLDLVDCAATGLGGSACRELVGGVPGDVPERYAWTSPLALVPPPAAVLAVHGTADDIVPLAQSERYVGAIERAGGAAELRAVAGADHFDVIDPTHESWRIVLEALGSALGAG